MIRTRESNKYEVRRRGVNTNSRGRVSKKILEEHTLSCCRTNRIGRTERAADLTLGKAYLNCMERMRYGPRFVPPRVREDSVCDTELFSNCESSLMDDYSCEVEALPKFPKKASCFRNKFIFLAMT